MTSHWDVLTIISLIFHLKIWPMHHELEVGKTKKKMHLNTYMYNSCNTLNNTQGGQSMMLFLVAELAVHPVEVCYIEMISFFFNF